MIVRGLTINRIRIITRTIGTTIRTIATITIKEAEMQVELNTRIYQTRE